MEYLNRDFFHDGTIPCRQHSPVWVRRCAAAAAQSLRNGALGPSPNDRAPSTWSSCTAAVALKPFWMRDLLAPGLRRTATASAFARSARMGSPERRLPYLAHEMKGCCWPLQERVAVTTVTNIVRASGPERQGPWHLNRSKTGKLKIREHVARSQSVNLGKFLKEGTWRFAQNRDV